MTEAPEKIVLANNLTSELKEMSRNGVLTCGQLYQFARNNSIELQSMKPLIKAAGIEIKDCAQICISLRCKHFI